MPQAERAKLLAAYMMAGLTIVLLYGAGASLGVGDFARSVRRAFENHGMDPRLERRLKAAGAIVLCDRFYDSTLAYQGYGRGLALDTVRSIIDAAVGETRPHLTLLLLVPVKISEARRKARLLPGLQNVRDRMEEADRGFFERVEAGYRQLALEEPGRVRGIDATVSQQEVSREIWALVETLVRKLPCPANPAVDNAAVSAILSVPKKKLSF